MKRQTIHMDPEIWDEAKSQAKRVSMTTAEYVRQATLEKLDGSSNQRVMQEVENLRQTVEELRNDLAESTRAILILAGSKKPLPKDKAEAWVKENLQLRRTVGEEG
ncbi:MAG: hypothetical protein AAF591_20670 [Verrucomicrobiota bacterium]